MKKQSQATLGRVLLVPVHAFLAIYSTPSGEGHSECLRSSESDLYWL